LFLTFEGDETTIQASGLIPNATKRRALTVRASDIAQAHDAHARFGSGDRI
jgi:hypothetical protein